MTGSGTAQRIAVLGTGSVGSTLAPRSPAPATTSSSGRVTPTPWTAADGRR